MLQTEAYLTNVNYGRKTFKVEATWLNHGQTSANRAKSVQSFQL
jgi:hypothetical protein